MRPINLFISLTALLAPLPLGAGAAAESKPWLRHTIDGSSRGADGVRLADASGDGRLDIATGWEEGGQIRVYLHPGHAKAKERWPAVTVGTVKSPEDAVFVDLDGDGALDVVSSCEGNTKSIFVHWAPGDRDRYLDASAWKTEAIPAAAGQMWMYALPMQVDGKRGMDLVVGSKGKDACVGWLEAPADPRDLGAWKLHRLRDAGWIMSLIAADIDGDGDDDILLSDRKGSASGAYWLERMAAATPGDAPTWREHTIGGVGSEMMFIERDAVSDKPAIVGVEKPNLIVWFTPPAQSTDKWKKQEIACDTQRFGRVKAARAGDITGSGKTEFIVTCEGAAGAKSGVYLVKPGATSRDKPTFIDIGGPEGVKYDRIEIIDLDDDGDLDVLTCEESDNLGVIWYENPMK